jgi:hypothetical protein
MDGKLTAEEIACRFDVITEFVFSVPLAAISDDGSKKHRVLDARADISAHIAVLDAELAISTSARKALREKWNKAEADKQIAVEALRDIAELRLNSRMNYDSATGEHRRSVQAIARQALSRIEEK